MKFKIRTASNYNGNEKPCEGYWSEWFIEINTLEDLIKFGDKCGYKLVIDTEDKEIIIYDDYLE